MKCAESLIRIIDFYKKSPDLNINEFQYKTSRTTLCLTYAFIIFVILANLTSIQNIWKDSKDLKVISQGIILQSQSITPFNLGLYFQSGCYQYQYWKIVKVFSPLTNITYQSSACTEGMTALYQYDNFTSCFVCFTLQNIKIISMDSIGFQILYDHEFFHDPLAVQFRNYSLIIQHQSYNPEKSYVNTSYSYEILKYIPIYNINGNESSTMVKCDVTQIYIDDSLFDWSSSQQISYFGNCYTYEDYKKYIEYGNYIYTAKVSMLSFQRVKISVILSNLISFGFLASFLMIFFQSYNNYLFRLELAKQILYLEDVKTDYNINYFTFVVLKLLKYQFIRQKLQHSNPQSKYLKLYYIMIQMNRILSIENIVYSLQQIYQNILQEEKDIQDHNIFAFLSKSQENPSTLMIQQSRQQAQEIIPFDVQFYKQPSKSLIRRILEVFDLFSSPVQFEEEEVFSTSCFSITITISALFILGMLIYATGISNILYTSDQIYTTASVDTVLNIQPNILQTYIIAINTNTSLPVDMQTLADSIAYNISIYDENNNYLRSIDQSNFFNCTAPHDFPTGNNSIIHYCINSRYSLHGSFITSEKVRIQLMNKVNYFLNLNYFVYQRYNNYRNGEYNIQWIYTTYSPFFGYQNLNYILSFQNIFIVKQKIQYRSLFADDKITAVSIINQLNQENSKIPSRYFQELHINLFVANVQQLIIKPDQSVFTIIINFLGINYLIFLFIVKQCSYYFNKRKSLGAMSKHIHLTNQKKGQCEILYDSVINISLAVPQTYENIQEYQNLMNYKWRQFQILNIKSIIKTKLKIEFLNKNLFSFGYFRRKLKPQQQLQQQQELKNQQQ